MPKTKLFLMLVSLVILAVGCAEIRPLEAPETVLKHPLGTDPIRLGMTKDKIRNLWGDPDQVNSLGQADQWGTMKEEWVYEARYSKIPLDKGYISKTKYLYFEGDVLTSFGDEPEDRPTDSPEEK